MQLRLLMCPYSLHVCCLPKEVGANPKPSHYSFSPFLSSISCPLSEVTVLPSTVVQAEKSLLGHTVDASALAIFRESW